MYIYCLRVFVVVNCVYVVLLELFYVCMLTFTATIANMGHLYIRQFK